MANFYVTNNKYPSNPQIFAISLHKIAGIGVDEDNPNFKPNYRNAEPTWKLFIYTSGLDSEGDPVGPLVAGVFGGEDELNSFIEEKIAELCDLIDWSQQGEFSPQSDSSAPVIAEQYPVPNQTDVSISSPIVIRVRDLVPAAGIDPSTAVMTVDGFDVTPSYVGNKYDMTFTFKPRPIFFE